MAQRGGMSPRRLLCWAAAAAVLSAAAGANVGLLPVAADSQHQHGTGLLQQVIRLDDGTVIQVEEFRGPPRAAALPYLFTNCRVEVHCPGHTDYAVYTGRSMEAVRAAYGRADRAWCGLAHLLRDSPNCTVGVSPHGSTFVAVAKPRTWLARGSEGRQCRLTRQEALSTPRLLAALLGAALFWYAGLLSESTPFRLTGGTLGFMALSSIIVLFLLYRRVPHKGKLLAGAAIFGSSFVATMRYLFGVWLPSAHQVLRHPLTQTYFAASGLAGLALTYYYNNTENRKVNTMLRVALQLVGLAAVYLSSTMHEAGAALSAGLLGAKALAYWQQHPSWRSAWGSAKREVVQPLVEEEAAAGAAAAAAGRGAAGRPAAAEAAAAPRQQQQLERTPAVGGAARQQMPEVSPLIQRGMVLNEETGHIIGIGKATYNRLVDAGYVVDQVAGTITPPPPAPESPARPGGRASGKARRRHTP